MRHEHETKKPKRKMWRFFSFFNGEPTPDSSPEIVISGGAESGNGGGGSSKDNDDDDNDKDRQTTDGSSIVYTERFADEAYDDADEDDDENSAGRDAGAVDEEFYQELSDAEPDSDFVNGCFEYLPMGEFCYLIRRVGSKETHILAHESTAVVAFCYALQKYSDREIRRIVSEDKAVDETELDELSEKNPNPTEVPAPLGVIGWFIQNGMNSKPVFAFDSEDADRKKIIDLTSNTPVVLNSAVVAAGNASGVPLFENGHNSEDRIALAYRYGIGIGNEILQGRDRRFLRLFQRYGHTTRQSFDPVDDRDGFISESPATPSNGRWFVIDAQHYALYRSNEELVSRSGASLSRLAATLDSDKPVLKAMPVGVTQQQMRAVFEQYLKEENIQKERERERARFNKISLLRVKCSQIVGLREFIRNLKAPAQSILSTNTTHGPADISFIADTLAEIEKIIEDIGNERITSY